MHRLSHYGIFSDYLDNVPVWLITAAHPGLLGAGLALSNQHLRHRQI
jgi:glucokinase